MENNTIRTTRIKETNTHLEETWGDKTNYVAGNEAADKLADIGRRKQKRDIIPEAMGKYLALNGGESMMNKDIRAKVREKHKAINNKAFLTVMEVTEDVDIEISNTKTAEGEVNRKITNRWRTNNNTTTQLIEENLRHKKRNKWKTLKDLTYDHKCLHCIRAVDHKYHVLQCPRTVKFLKEQDEKINNKLKERFPHLKNFKVPPHWITARDVTRQLANPSDTGKLPLNLRRKWKGSKGWFYKNNAQRLKAVAGKDKGKEIAVEINEIILQTWADIERDRRRLINKAVEALKSGSRSWDVG
jgi:hypothetical protein